MVAQSRRGFLGEVGRGMILAGVGASLASELGLYPAHAQEVGDELSFGPLDPLVTLMQDTPVDRLQPILVRKLQDGTASLRQLIAAAALANAETFGGEDYVGYHAEMALLPALNMANQLAPALQPLPVLKVLYRNTHQIQNLGGSRKKTLHHIDPVAPPLGQPAGESLRAATRDADMQRAESLFAALAQDSVEQSFEALQFAVQDAINVHRFVLAHRAYGLIDVVGQANAHTILRQCVRFCVDEERYRLNNKGPESPIRTLLPRLLDRYQLVERPLGTREPGDAWVGEMARTLYENTNVAAAEAVAAALAEGILPETVGEASSLAANFAVLRQGKDPWRTHGASIGVHASDAMNAWRNMARHTSPRHVVAGLIVGAYHTADSEPFPTEPYPTAEHRASITRTDPQALLEEAEDAIRHNDQGRATAAIQIYSEQDYPERPVFDLMLKYAISEDGRLHSEKYYQTVAEEFTTTRPAYRWRHLVGLARVTASAYGYDGEDNPGFRAPGFEQACQLLGVKL
jgi:hypothetical protein